MESSPPPLLTNFLISKGKNGFSLERKTRAKVRANHCCKKEQVGDFGRKFRILLKGFRDGVLEKAPHIFAKKEPISAKKIPKINSCCLAFN